MAITQALIDDMRQRIGDTDTSNQVYTDIQLQLFTVNAVPQIERLLSGGYSSDKTALTISPEPSSVWQVLFPLQGAINLLLGQYANSARKNLRVREGDTEIQLGTGLSVGPQFLKLLIEERDRLIAQAIADGLGTAGDVWQDTNNVIEKAPSFADFENGESTEPFIIISNL